MLHFKSMISHIHMRCIIQKAAKLGKHTKTKDSVSSYIHRNFCDRSSPNSQAPLVEVFDAFLQQIKHHGEGNITLNTLPSANVADIYINNPSKRNCLSGRMIHQLMTIIDTLSTDPRYTSTVAVLLRGHGSESFPSANPTDGPEPGPDPSLPPAFCAGLDFSLAKEVVNTPDQGFLMCSMMTEALTRLRSLDMISVALIHGPALGGGAELATSCDYRVITDAATSQIGFVHGKLGASPGWGGGGRLFEIVGRRNALRLFGTAKILCPQEALEMGLADVVLETPGSSVVESTSSSSSSSSVSSSVSSSLSSSPRLSYVEQCISFVEPFTSMPYPLAVKDMKLLIAGQSAASCHAEAARQLEKDVFKRRWGSPDNMSALSTK